jgi:hypothetical protein
MELIENGKDPLDLARENALAVRERLGRQRAEKGAPVRKSFVRASMSGVEGPPMMARLLRDSRRGGALRVKLYLSVLWRAAKAPYEVEGVPARSWAVLLGLEDPRGRGERRVQQAIRDLDEIGLLTRRKAGGGPDVLRPLNESGDRSPYEPPSETHHRLKASGTSKEDRREHQYFRLPSWLWTEGYLARLESPGLAALLILGSNMLPRRPRVLIDRATADAEYGLSERTRGKGLEELRRLDMLSTEIESVDERGQGVGFTRRRNVHTLALEFPPLGPIKIQGLD